LSRAPHGAAPARRFVRLAGAVAALAVAVVPAWAGTAGDAGEVSFARALLRLEARRAGKVRVLHFGDSHTVSGPVGGLVGGALRAAFGDGGPGLGLPWTPPPYSVREGLRSGTTSGWRRVMPRYGDPPSEVGLWGCAVETDEAGQTAWIRGEAASVRVAYLRQPGGGAVQFLLDGAPIGEADLAAPAPEVGVFEWNAGGDAARRLEIRTTRRGRTRILGTTLERAEGGIVYSPVGILGARADLLLKSRDDVFGALMRLEAPDLVIVAFGANEAGDRPFDPRGYAALFDRALARIRAAAPQAEMLVVAPPDRAERAANGEWRSMATLDEIARIQESAARRRGAAFFDLRRAMGGEGQIVRWAERRRPLAQADHVHYTSEGYARLAQWIASEVFDLYGRARRAPALLAELRAEGDGSSDLLEAARRPFTPPPFRGAAPPPTIADREPPDGPTFAVGQVRAERLPNGKIVLRNN